MSVQACAELVQKGDPARFRATMAAPVAARELLFPIHAFCLEVAKAPWVTQEAMIAEMRLQFWRDVLTEISEGKPPRAHEVAAPLSMVLDGVAAAALDATVTVRQWDIYRDPHVDEAALKSYLRASYARPMVEAARLLGAGDACRLALETLGFAGGLARYFAAIPALEEQGRVPLVDGRAEAVQRLAQEALGAAEPAMREVGRLSKSARAPMIDAMMHLPLLRQVAQAPDRVSAGDLGQGAFQAALRLSGVSQSPSWSFF